MLKKFLMTLLTLIILFGAVIGYASYNIWRQNNYKTLLQVISDDNTKLDYMLFTDMAGFGDRAWYVYKLPVDSKLKNGMKEAHNKEGVLFWNYSEAGNNTEEPNIEIINDRYLVFSRGYYYHSLYDIRKDKLLLNYISPWGSFTLSPEYKKLSDGPQYDDEMSLMDAWVRINIHERIKNIASID